MTLSKLEGIQLLILIDDGDDRLITFSNSKVATHAMLNGI